MLNNKALQVPYGTRDVLPGEAGARRIIENKLASTFKAWGYDEVVTPTFELSLIHISEPTRRS